MLVSIVCCRVPCSLESLKSFKLCWAHILELCVLAWPPSGTIRGVDQIDRRWVSCQALVSGSVRQLPKSLLAVKPGHTVDLAKDSHSKEM